jgi:hypothetical protein
MSAYGETPVTMQDTEKNPGVFTPGNCAGEKDCLLSLYDRCQTQLVTLLKTINIIMKRDKIVRFGL